MPEAGTRVVSVRRRAKLQERWADPTYREREAARLRAFAQEQREAVAFYRAHKDDPRLAAPAGAPLGGQHPASADAPRPSADQPPPAPAPKARRPTRKRAAARRGAARSTSRSRAGTGSAAPSTPPSAPKRRPFFLAIGRATQ